MAAKVRPRPASKRARSPPPPKGSRGYARPVFGQGATRGQTGGLAFLALQAACGGQEPIILPGAPGAAATVIVIEADGARRAEALEGDGAGRSLPDDLGEDWVADILHYDTPLSDLALAPGPLIEAAPGAPSRPLPPFDEAIEVRVEGGRSLGFQSIFEATGPAARFRLAAPDPLACVEAGGCLDGTPVPSCRLPCGEPTPPDPPAPPAAPAEPTAPVMTPCPGGWVVLSTPGPTRCSPPPRLPCADGYIQWSDLEGCVPLGACAPGPFPADLPAGVIHVDANGGGGDGSLAAPFRTLEEALLGATNGATVALARGRYSTPTPVPAGLRVIGACASEVIIDGPLELGPGASLRNLSGNGPWTVPDGVQVVLQTVALRGAEAKLSVSGQVQAQELWFEGGRDYGLSLEPGARAELDRLVATDVGPSALVLRTATATLTRGWLADLPGPDAGIDAAEGSALTLRAVALVRPSFRGVQVVDSQLSAEDLRIGEGQPVEGRGGVGVQVAGGRATLTRIGIESSRAVGLLLEERAQVQVRDLVVLTTNERQEDRLDGQGLRVEQGARAVVSRAHVEDSTHYGVLVRGAQARATLSDLTVLRTHPRASDQGAGTGVAVDQGARVILRRARIQDSHDRGLSLFDGATLDAQDLTIEDVASEASSGERGIGLWVAETSTAGVQRYRGTNTRRACLEHTSVGTSAFTDVQCQHIRPSPSRERTTAGLRASAGRVSLTRALLQDSKDAGLLVEGLGTVVIAQDLRVEQSEVRGAALALGGELRGERWLISQSGGEGVEAEGAAILDAEHVHIERSAELEDRAGQGLSLQFASVHLRHFAVVDNRDFGVSFVDGQLLLEDGLISGHDVGLLYSADEATLLDVLRRVTFRNNQRNLSR